MKIFKRIALFGACAIFSVASLSGCSAIFGNRCRHNTYSRGSDETAHYKICADCDKKFDVENHVLNISYSNSDKTRHFMQCGICGYRTSYKEHVFSEWNYNHANSIRKCTTKGCGYEEQCNHFNTQKYIVSDDGHYTECENCARKLTEKLPHSFSVYSDVTETAHTLSCKCGKIKDDGVPHELKYEHDDSNDTHRKTCKCGFETAAETCSYGDYVADSYGHFKVCAVCNEKSMTDSHNYELNANRKRLCKECSYEKEKYVLLIGTWAYNLNLKRHKLVLNNDWSYSLYTSGNLVEQGDYDVYHYFVGLKGDITGAISLYPRDSYGGQTIEFKFQSGEKNKFNDNINHITYVKQ